jgi:rRNA maturation endonuclease Nob1
MIDIKELKTKSYGEVAGILEQTLNEFKDEINKVVDIDSLKKFEEELMEEQKVCDEYIKGVQYTLPEAAEYDGERFTKNAIAKIVAEFLNRAEVDWQFTLGYFQIVKMWKSQDLKTIDYNAFDSTLRMLNNLKFKGFNDWRNILAVNEYMKGCHEPYSIDTSYMIFLNQKHQAIMDRLTMVEKREPINEQHEMPVE